MEVDMSKTVRSVGVTAAALALVAFGLWATLAVWNNKLEQFLLLAIVGGILIAAVLFAMQSAPTAQVRPDPFARDVFSSDPINYAHVRVAGLGGAGLVVLALIVALENQLTTAVLVAGLIGGAAAAVPLIVFRARERKRPAESGDAIFRLRSHPR
jgi:hypothetical protein